jgi:hypothetical protein
MDICGVFLTIKLRVHGTSGSAWLNSFTLAMLLMVKAWQSWPKIDVSRRADYYM